MLINLLVFPWPSNLHKRNATSLFKPLAPCAPLRVSKFHLFIFLERLSSGTIGLVTATTKVVREVSQHDIRESRIREPFWMVESFLWSDGTLVFAPVGLWR